MENVNEGIVRLRKRNSIKTKVDGFQISKIISKSQIRKFLKDSEHDVNSNINRITWPLACEFCNWLSQKHDYAPYYNEHNYDMEKEIKIYIKNGHIEEPKYKLGYHLPTEAQLALYLYRKRKRWFNVSIQKQWVNDWYYYNLIDYHLNYSNRGHNKYHNKEVADNLKNITQNILNYDSGLDNMLFLEDEQDIPLNSKHQIKDLLNKLQYLERYMPKNANYEGLIQQAKDLCYQVQQEFYESNELKYNTLIKLTTFLKMISEKCRTQLQRKSSIFKFDKEIEKSLVEYIKQNVSRDTKLKGYCNTYFKKLKQKYNSHPILTDNLYIKDTNIEELTERKIKQNKDNLKLKVYNDTINNHYCRTYNKTEKKAYADPDKLIIKNNLVDFARPKIFYNGDNMKFRVVRGL